ncbi:MAG: exodeoxyribonuclease V subunit gamma [Victivallales bacterium]|nr:exodeoxyribonuclease V subunit gamma [Victivallales bacterium]
MSFHLYTKNCLTGLAEAYIQAREKDLSLFRDTENLFTPEVVVIPTQGMQIWLEHQLVKSGQVVANRSWPRIQEYVNEILSKEFEGDEAFHPELFTRQVLLWRILELLREDERVGGKEFPGLYRYLHKEEVSAGETELLFLRQFQLSEKLAEVFDQYLCFLPELLAEAEKAEVCCTGEDPVEWQKRLWWKLCHLNGTAIHSPASRLVDYCNLAEVKHLRAPITVFGASAMSVWFLKVFQKAASSNEVHFFYHNICDEFWGDQDRKLGKSLELKEDENGFEEFNNSLLCKFGEQGRRFFNAFMDAGLILPDETWEDSTEREFENCWTEHAVDDKLSLLHAIQKHIRTCTNPPRETVPELPAWDDSLTVHRCHNEKREVEELQNALLYLIQTHHYKMTDILVMAPDISQFAPIISSVLDKGPLAGKYTVSDKSIRHANLMAEAFLAILDIGNTRFEVRRVMNLLDSQPLRDRFGLEDDDIIAIRTHLSQMRVRWGLNGASRILEFPGLQIPFEEYTWEQGLDRMLLALAMDETIGNNRFGSLIAPLISTSSENRHWLGTLCHFLTLLRKTAASITRNTSKTMPEWVTFLHELQNTFFQVNADSAWDSTLLRKSIEDLATAAHTAGCDELSVPYPVIQCAITSILESASPGSSFLGGKLTFCSMQPMRGIPCKVIAILGLDERTFPRQESKLGFNLLALSNGPEEYKKYLKFYDRDRTVEDRYIFLETILAAQDYLLLFHRGLDDHFTGERGTHPPAAPVDELMEYASRVRKGSIQIDHRLNPYDPKAFSPIKAPSPQADALGHSYDGRLRTLFSYDANALQLAKNDSSLAEGALEEASEEEEGDLPRPAFIKNWKAPEEIQLPGTTVDVSLSSLEYFLKNPQEHFLQNCLNFPKSEWEEEQLSDYEPFKASPLDASNLTRRIGEQWIKDQAAGAPGDSLYSPAMEQLKENLRLQNKLTIGGPGEKEFEDFLLNVSKKSLPPEVMEAWIRAEKKQGTLLLEDIPLNLPDELSNIPGYRQLEKTPAVTVNLQYDFLWSPKGLVEGVYSVLRGRHYIRPYLNHLVNSLLGNNTTTYLINKNQKPFTFHSCTQDEAKAYLKRILQLYFVNMRFPLPLFSNLSPMAVTKAPPNANPQADPEHPAGLLNSTVINEWETDKNKLAYSLLFPTEENSFRKWHSVVLNFANYCYEQFRTRKVLYKEQ